MSTTNTQKSGRLPAWSGFDTTWMLSLYGTAIGAGVLFLPINAGIGGLIPMLVMLVLAFPMTFFAHRALSRFVQSSKNPNADITEAVEEHFGLGAGTIITILYFLAIFPICLVYSVSLTNTVFSFAEHQLHVDIGSRWIVSLVIVLILMFIVRFGGELIVRVMSVLVFPFIIVLVAISFYLIQFWNGNLFNPQIIAQQSGDVPALLKTLWLAIPVMVFAFNHSPIISTFSLTTRGHYGEANCDGKSSQILAAAELLMVVTVMFFVFSCALALSPADLQAAKDQNITILSYLANHFNTPILEWVAPIVAIVAITKSFLGHYLGAAEGFKGIFTKIYHSKGMEPNHTSLNLITYVFMLVSCWVVAALNPSILGLIESLGGPVLGVILFLMPMYAISKIDALAKYRGKISNVFTVVMGLVAISAVLYGFM